MQGARSDLTSCRDACYAGSSRRALLDDFPDVVAKYPRFIDTCLKQAREDAVKKMTTFSAKFDWQSKLISVVDGPVDPRAIYWVHDAVGNHGKTFASIYLVDVKSAFYCNGGKGVDLVYAYEGQSVVIFDYVRDAKDYVNYGVVEQLKNGILFSSKYESGCKRFDPPHVFVFANFAPDQSKFSSDRLRLWELNSIGQIIGDH